MPAFTAVTRRAGDRYLSRWRLTNGSILDTDLSQAEYAALALKGAGTPPRNGAPADAVWLVSASVPTFNTPDGRLAFGDFELTAVNGGRYSVVLGLDTGEMIPLTLNGPIQSQVATVVWRGVTYQLSAGTVVRL